MSIKRENEKDIFSKAWNERSKYNVSKLVPITNDADVRYYTYTKNGSVIKEFTQTISGETFVIAFKDSACKIKAGIVLLDGFKLIKGN